MSEGVGVPFIDLRAVNATDIDEICSALAAVARSGQYLFGEQLSGFEREFAAYCGVRSCVGVANGLDALRLSLQAWVSLGRLKPGDEVVVPANSFIASALAVEACGLTVRFCDVDPGTFNMSLETLRAAATARTRVVMPVHLFGQIALSEDIAAWCSANEMLVLEDSAQAQGAELGGKRAGSIGDAGAFSFYPTKNLGAFGDSGCVVTNDEELAERVRALGNYGSARKYDHVWRGINSRMNELQACVLRIKLRNLDSDNAARRRVAMRYHAGLGGSAVDRPVLPRQPNAHVWHIFAVRTPMRESLIAHLHSREIQTLVHYPKAIPRQPAFASSANYGPFPWADRLQGEVLSLPISSAMSDEWADRVVSAVASWPGA